MQRALLLIVLFIAILGWTAALAAADQIALAQTTQAGQTATYTIELLNDTPVTHDYGLALAGFPQAMTATLSEGGPVPDRVRIAANTYRQIALRVDVPPDTAVGRYAAAFTATRDDNTVMTLPIVLHVENTYSVRITSQNVNVNTFSGQEFSFEATASNMGAAPITNVALAVDVVGTSTGRYRPGGHHSS